MKKIILITGLLILISMSNILADNYTAKSHKMMINGTSTLHNWEAPANKLVAKGDFTIANNILTSVNNMYVEVETKSIKSEKESMDDKIYECLKATDNPKITFKLNKVNTMTQAGNEWTLATTGILIIGGTPQTIDMQVKAKLNADGTVEFAGSKLIKLSQFKLERPSAMLGTIKCGDDITLTFSVIMKK